MSFFPLDCEMKKEMTTNITIAIWCKWIKIIFFVFCQIGRNIFVGVLLNFWLCAMSWKRLEITGFEHCIFSGRSYSAVNCKRSGNILVWDRIFWTLIKLSCLSHLESRVEQISRPAWVQADFHGGQGIASKNRIHLESLMDWDGPNWLAGKNPKVPKAPQ